MDDEARPDKKSKQVARDAMFSMLTAEQLQIARPCSPRIRRGGEAEISG